MLARTKNTRTGTHTLRQAALKSTPFVTERASAVPSLGEDAAAGGERKKIMQRSARTEIGFVAVFSTRRPTYLWRFRRGRFSQRQCKGAPPPAASRSSSSAAPPLPREGQPVGSRRCQGKVTSIKKGCRTICRRVMSKNLNKARRGGGGSCKKDQSPR